MMSSTPLITLTTDFGTSDAYVGILHGVILRICPQARIVDITHQVPPQDIAAAAALLPTFVAYFPDGTIHVVVVDPGVGSERRVVALDTGRARFVGPDNGVFGHIWQEAAGAGSAARAVVLKEPRFWLPQISHTFHGRDIFAPVAAHLACGVALEELGPPAGALAPALEDAPQLIGASIIEGRVIHIDHFGNCISNLSEELLGRIGPLEELSVMAGGHFFGPIRRTYAEVQPGEALALLDSSGRLECALCNGSAAAAFGLVEGAVVRVSRG